MSNIVPSMRMTCFGSGFSPANPIRITVDEISKIIGAGSNLDDESVREDSRRLLVAAVVVDTRVLLRSSGMVLLWSMIVNAMMIALLLLFSV